MKNRFFLFVFFILSSCVNKTYVRQFALKPESAEFETGKFNDIKVGKWLLKNDYKVASWLGYAYKNKTLQEPINLIILDGSSKTPEQAVDMLLINMDVAGYPMRFGHSGGYNAFIGNGIFAQLPNGSCCTFSDGFFLLTNNHGRIFGPYKVGDLYVFVAAFSREGVSALPPFHTYQSFMQARDDVAIKLNKKTDFGIVDIFNIKNMIDDEKTSVGDHDGTVVVLRR